MWEPFPQEGLHPAARQNGGAEVEQAQGAGLEPKLGFSRFPLFKHQGRQSLKQSRFPGY